MRLKSLLGLALLLLSRVAFASDPTPIFAIFVVPFLVLMSAIVVLFGCLHSRLGVIFFGFTSVMVNIALAIWAMNVGAVEDIGGWIAFLFVVNAISITVAVKKLDTEDDGSRDA